MPDIIRWEPFRDLISLRDAMDRLFAESYIRPTGLLPTFLTEGNNVPVDMYETDQDVVLKASIPGVKPEDIDISIVGDDVTIKGHMEEKTEVKEESYVRREMRYGSMSRTVSLPTSVQADKADAKFENGVLTLTLPKAEEVKPKTVKVQAVK
jgi:HSP20 family protein